MGCTYLRFLWCFTVFGAFFQLGLNPCKAEKPLQGMKLQEKEAQKD